jgi:Haemopoietic lineage transmembrane helix
VTGANSVDVFIYFLFAAAEQPWWHHWNFFFFLLASAFDCFFFRQRPSDIINTTKSIAADIQVMMNHTVVQAGTFVSENIWASDLFQASVISALFLIAYWSIIYLDSSQPGVNPPSPLASLSRKK